MAISPMIFDVNAGSLISLVLTIQDLKQRGMLDDTLVVWGGEFGRTIYCKVV